MRICDSTCQFALIFEYLILKIKIFQLKKIFPGEKGCRAVWNVEAVGFMVLLLLLFFIRNCWLVKLMLKCLFEQAFLHQIVSCVQKKIIPKSGTMNMIDIFKCFCCIRSYTIFSSSETGRNCKLLYIFPFQCCFFAFAVLMIVPLICPLFL